MYIPAWSLIHERVEKGIELLNKVEGRDWPSKMDLDHLSMDWFYQAKAFDLIHCNNLADMRREGAVPGFPRDYGFMSDETSYESEIIAVWMKYILQLRGEQPTPTVLRHWERQHFNPEQKVLR